MSEKPKTLSNHLVDPVEVIRFPPKATAEAKPCSEPEQATSVADAQRYEVPQDRKQESESPAEAIERMLNEGGASTPKPI